MLILLQLACACVFGTLYHTDEIMGPEGAMYFVRPFSHNETVEYYLSKLKKNNKQLLSLRNQMTQLIMENKQIKTQLLKLNALHYAESDIIRQLEFTELNVTLNTWNDGSFIKCLYHQRSSSKPTNSPTQSPSVSPTSVPTHTPTQNPTISPSISPTLQPSMQPSNSPTMRPTISPAIRPTKSPTVNPTAQPTKSPTEQWDVKSVPKGKNKSNKRKCKSAKSLAETSKDDELLLNQHILKHQNVASQVTQLSRNIIEIHEITQEDPTLFNDRLIDIISKNHSYDYIITKTYDDQVINSSVEIAWYYEKIDRIYDSAMAVYLLLLMHGPTIQNLRKFGDGIDAVDRLCMHLQANTNDSVYKLNNQTSTATEMKRQVIEMKLKSEYDAKLLALRACQAFFFSVHDMKVMRAKKMSRDTTSEWDKRKARLQMIFDQTMKAAALHQRVVSNKMDRSRLWESQLSYLPSYNNLKDIVHEINVLKDGCYIGFLLSEWRIKHAEGKRFKICVLVSTANGLLLDQLPKWNDTTISIHNAVVDQKKGTKIIY